MTDYRFLNDSHEHEKGFSFLKEALKNFNDYPDDLPSEVRDSIEDQIYFASTSTLGEGDLGRSVFVSSLCKSTDSLTQWITYGGFSINFDMDSLLSSVGKNGDFDIFDCQYYDSREHGIELASSILKEEIMPKAIEYRMKNSDFDDPFYMIDSIIKHSLILKPSSFKHENEKRIVALRNTGFVNDIKFRCSGELLIPYIDFGFDAMAIKGIMVGPSSNQDRVLSSLMVFLSNINHRWKLNVEIEKERSPEYNITLNKSEIPYRG
ncbi:TPA: DUF2971 domain-containing protein [Klebsiella pneumoniae]|uniref:DUF2971 domain-containing protein n=2 Tax=Enterobacteriaceae TaxID=543 RepID=UPI001090F628|nr:DUF2971 domain-containing protein [Klebsiella pneumoniae]MBQ5031775.1 DUF2971 domain-containing protein [Klebsiella pneumoniae]HCT3831904.1 DUF2971 domain-containing protein [Klebsiella pneumoniae]HCT9799515.1 DUF2971 domain-containing protein [Klebsiella pneumoniae]